MKRWIPAVLAAVLLFCMAAPAASAAEKKPSFSTAVEQQAYQVLENWETDRANQDKIQRVDLFPENLPTHVAAAALASGGETFAKYLADGLQTGNEYTKAITGLHLVGVDESDSMRIYEAAMLLYHGSNLALFAMIGVIGAAAVIVMIPVSAVLMPMLTTELALDQLVELERDAE